MKIKAKTKKLDIFSTCGCEFHLIEIEEFTIQKEHFVSICIYQHKSMQTGRLFKNKKLLADVVLSGEEYSKLKKFFKE